MKVPIYEVQANDVTLEFTPVQSEAQSAYAKATNNVTMFKLMPNGIKNVMYRK